MKSPWGKFYVSRKAMLNDWPNQPESKKIRKEVKERMAKKEGGSTNES